MRVVALLCFFVSGASGLIFEVIWTRMFSLVFGATTLAISTVLTAFMGGLALGSHLLGKRADKVRDPLRAYALCEGGIGAYALLIPLVLQGFPSLNHWLWSAFGDRYWLLSVLRFAASAALLLAPTTLMGATLTLLARYVVRQPWHQRRVGTRVGALYALNTAGAVVGTSAPASCCCPASASSAATPSPRAPTSRSASWCWRCASACVAARSRRRRRSRS